MIPPFQNLMQLLYYIMTRGEKWHPNVRVVGWRATLLQHGEQAIDKEMDIGKDAFVLSSGPTQA